MRYIHLLGFIIDYQPSTWRFLKCVNELFYCASHCWSPCWVRAAAGEERQVCLPNRRAVRQVVQLSIPPNGLPPSTEKSASKERLLRMTKFKCLPIHTASNMLPKIQRLRL